MGVKKPQEKVKKAVGALAKLDSSKKSIDELTKSLADIRQALYTDGNDQSDVIAAISQEIYSSHLLHSLVVHFDSVDFECKRDIVQIFNKVMRREVGNRMPSVDYVAGTKPEVLTLLVKGYENDKIALNTGLMLRECLKHEALAKIILNNEELFLSFFTYVQDSQFDVAADAFASFKDLLTKHKIICAEFLEKRYDMVFDEYRKLLESSNYVTKRQSLKLLGELLLDRANYTVMTKYIGNPENLKLMMNMLKVKSRNIQFEAFHVFKVFVANPSKSKPIMDILLKNKDKLVAFLEKFHNDRAEDDQFSDEKKYLIKQIKELK